MDIAWYYCEKDHYKLLIKECVPQRKKKHKEKIKMLEGRGGGHCQCRGTEYGRCLFVLLHCFDFYAPSSLMWPIHYVLRRPGRKQTKWEPLIVSLESPPESRGKFPGSLWTWPLISYSHPQASDGLASSKESLAGKSCPDLTSEWKIIKQPLCGYFVKILFILFREMEREGERGGKKHGLVASRMHPDCVGTCDFTFLLVLLICISDD